VTVKRSLAKFVRINCDCGTHYVDLYATSWNKSSLGFYTCNECKRPLICRGDDGEFYYVGGRVG